MNYELINEAHAAYPIRKLSKLPMKQLFLDSDYERALAQWAKLYGAKLLEELLNLV